MLWYVYVHVLGRWKYLKLGECRQSQGGCSRLVGSQYIGIRI